MNKHKTSSIFGPSSFLLILTLLVILICGLGVRLYDLKDPPLDYAATRQLRSALIARGIYYKHNHTVPEWKREMAIHLSNLSMLEPPINEAIVAGTYLIVGGEHLWIARIYSAFFWVLGGVILFLLAKEMVSTDGAIISLTFYLFSPFGMIVSRSFQPDLLMTTAIIFSWWTFYHWNRTSTRKWAVLTGLSTGLALLVKSTSVFFLFGGMTLGVLSEKKLKNVIQEAQTWVVVILSALPAVLYNLYGMLIQDELQTQFQGLFYPQLWSSFSFYASWLSKLSKVLGFELILLMGLLGIFFVKSRKDRTMLTGIWLGYLLFGFIFSYHFITHSYYHLPTTPLLAISLGALAEYLFQWIRKFKLENIVRVSLLMIIIVSVALGYYMVMKDDYRHEPDWYQTVAGYVGDESKVIALTQDYGNRIRYYGWINPRIWHGTEDMERAAIQGSTPKPFTERFSDYTAGYDYFLVTRLKELKRQEKLYNELYNNYTIYKEGGGFVIFDLNQPRQ